MAHYAFLDNNNVVINVIVGKDEGEDGIDWEQWYGDFNNVVCKRTSYNTYGGVHYADLDARTPSQDQTKAFRKNYATIGGTYDPVRDAFIHPQPYQSWTLNEQTCQWDSPLPYPEDGNTYTWDEEGQTWVLLKPPQG